jgi:hypothetical protein
MRYLLALAGIFLVLHALAGVTLIYLSANRPVAYKVSEPNSTRCEVVKTSEEAVVWSCRRKKEENPFFNSACLSPLDLDNQTH